MRRPRLRFTLGRMMGAVAVLAPFLSLLRQDPRLSPQSQALRYAVSRPSGSPHEATAIYLIAEHAEETLPGLLARRPTIEASPLTRPHGPPLPLSWSYRVRDGETGRLVWEGEVHFGLKSVNAFRAMTEPRDGAGAPRCWRRRGNARRRGRSRTSHPRRSVGFATSCEPGVSGFGRRSLGRDDRER